MAFIRHSIWLLLALSACQVQAQRAGAARPAQVVTAPITFEKETKRVETVGTAEAVHSVIIYPAVADKVTAVNFVPGQSVSMNDALVELDSRRQKVALERVTIQLADAERTVDRLEKSRKRGAISQSALDDALTARDLLKVQLIEAETELEDRTVRAPFSGVVGLTDIEPGDRIGLQTAITSIDDRKQLLVNFNAPETALSMLQGKTSVELEPWQARTQRITAEISEVDSRIDLTNRSIRVRALLQNKEDLYRPGMSFRVTIEVEGNEYAVVPEAALMWGATSAYIWLVESGKAKKVDIQIQQRLSGRLLVSGDIKLGDELIVEGVQRLREGQNVQSANVKVNTQ